MSISNESRFTVPFSHINKVFDMFVGEGNVAECEYLLKAKANPDLNQHLFSLCLNEDEETENRNELISLFLKYKANVFLEDEHGRLAMFGCLLKSNMEGVKLLMEYNCSINIQNKNKQSFLHYAFQEWGYALDVDRLNVREMMELGYDVNVQDPEGFTVLHRLMEKIGFEDGENSFLRLLDAFLQHKEIKLNVKNNEGETLLHLAQHEYSIIRLLEAKADLNIRDNQGTTAFKKVITGEGGRTPKVIKFLLENKCALIDLNNEENSMIHLYLDVQNKENFVKVECIKCMIEHKLDLNQSLGETTVHEQIISKYYDMFHIVYNQGYCYDNSYLMKYLAQYLQYLNSLGISLSGACKGKILRLIEERIEKKDSKSLDVLLRHINFKQDLSVLLLKLADLSYYNNRCDNYVNNLCGYNTNKQLPLIKVMVKGGVTCSQIDQILLHYILRLYEEDRDDVFVRSLVDLKADPNYKMYSYDEDLSYNKSDGSSDDPYRCQSYLEIAHDYGEQTSLVFTLLACGAEIPSDLYYNDKAPKNLKIIDNAKQGRKFWTLKNHHLFCEKYVSMIRTFLLCLRAVGVSRRILPLPLLCRILESAVVYRTFPKMERRSSLDNVFDEEFKRKVIEFEELKGNSTNEIFCLEENHHRFPKYVPTYKHYYDINEFKQKRRFQKRKRPDNDDDDDDSFY